MITENRVTGTAKAIVDGKLTYLSRCTPIDPLVHCNTCIRRDKRLPPLLSYSAPRCWGGGPSYYIPGVDMQFPDD
jgi:hypothetical protein